MKETIEELKKEKNNLLRQLNQINSKIKQLDPNQIKSGTRISDIKVLETIKESKSVRDVIDKLNMNKGGSTYRRIKRIADENGLSLSKR